MYPDDQDEDGAARPYALRWHLDRDPAARRPYALLLRFAAPPAGPGLDAAGEFAFPLPVSAYFPTNETLDAAELTARALEDFLLWLAEAYGGPFAEATDGIVPAHV